MLRGSSTRLLALITLALTLALTLMRRVLQLKPVLSRSILLLQMADGYHGIWVLVVWRLLPRPTRV